MEGFNRVRGIAHDIDVAKVTVRGVPDRPGVAAAIFAPLSDAHLSVDTIVQNVSDHDLTDITFTLAKNDLKPALPLVQDVTAFLPGTAAGSLVGAVTGAGQGTPGVVDVISGPRAVVTVTAYIVVAVVTTGILVRRRDVN